MYLQGSECRCFAQKFIYECLLRAQYDFVINIIPGVNVHHKSKKY